MSAVLSEYPADLPTMTTDTLNGIEVVIEDRPELEHLGIRFRAFYRSSPNGIDGVASTETGAVDALAEADQEETERRAELAADGELPWYLQ